MNKIFLFFVSLFMGTFCLKAEVSLVAILSHGDEITTFQSTGAYAQAVSKAVDGDIITLSSGNFTATDITKNITIRGAGMMPGEAPTVLNGDFSIDINPTQTGSLTIEGIYSPNTLKLNQANEIMLLKCWIPNVTGNQNTLKISSIRFIHCFITNNCSFANKSVTSAQFINSYIESYRGANDGSFSFTNCIIGFSMATYGGAFKNSIITNSTSSSNSTYSNCISNSYNFSGQPISAGNKYLPEITDFFKEDSDRYELKDEYATLYLGDDGLQVGIYGGSIPFDPATTSLRITKFNISARTTADGKLPVEIEVDAN